MVSNVEIGAHLGVEPSWIEQVSGIVERRFAADDETAVDMAERAALHCLQSAGAPAGDIGMLIMASGTGARRFPGPAAVVSHRLGLAGVPALDLPIASAGSIFGLCLAAQLTPSHGNVLVVAAEKLSEVILRQPVEPGTAALFGDGAGACLVSTSGGTAEILSCTMHSDGAFAEDLRLDFGGPVVMNGRSVILQASRKIPRCILQVLEQTEIPPGRVGAFILHQANRNLLDAVSRALGVPPDRFYCNIQRYGNTSSASMLIAASEWSETAGSRSGEPLVFAGFGAGFHWGALVAVGVPA
ncbi:MAG: ketoacyl-ACP synthase III [Candidatus Solibacter sp.]|nr:ketoacyl-ACP synthase III [Candidatus Solibacter sp.]